MLSFLACALGIYLGLHFNVLLVVPVTLVGGAAIFVCSSLSGGSLLEGASATVFPIIFCQAGYMVGLTARDIYGQLLARLKIRHSKQA